MACVFPGPSDLTLCVFQFHPFTWKFYDVSFLCSWTKFHYVHAPLFPYLITVDIHLSLFYFLATINRVINEHRCTSIFGSEIYCPLSICLRMIWLGHLKILYLVFKETSQLIFKMTTLYSHQWCKMFPFSLQLLIPGTCEGASPADAKLQGLHNTGH